LFLATTTLIIKIVSTGFGNRVTLMVFSGKLSPQEIRIKELEQKLLAR
jgi:hypothetical protein